MLIFINFLHVLTLQSNSTSEDLNSVLKRYNFIGEGISFLRNINCWDNSEIFNSTDMFIGKVKENFILFSTKLEVLLQYQYFYLSIDSNIELIQTICAKLDDFSDQEKHLNLDLKKTYQALSEQIIICQENIYNFISLTNNESNNRIISNPMIMTYKSNTEGFKSFTEELMNMAQLLEQLRIVFRDIFNNTC
ncbi:hypothetical protein H311_01553 [Anncaliia algerae PRA109]|nr:hypothetical protein H311_01553 [Anncaliia algerae PRA109]